jgi:hypothetical protein
MSPMGRSISRPPWREGASLLPLLPPPLLPGAPDHLHLHPGHDGQPVDAEHRPVGIVAELVHPLEAPHDPHPPALHPDPFRDLDLHTPHHRQDGDRGDAGREAGLPEVQLDPPLEGQPQHVPGRGPGPLPDRPSPEAQEELPGAGMVVGGHRPAPFCRGGQLSSGRGSRGPGARHRQGGGALGKVREEGPELLHGLGAIHLVQPPLQLMVLQVVGGIGLDEGLLRLLPEGFHGRSLFPALRHPSLLRVSRSLRCLAGLPAPSPPEHVRRPRSLRLDTTRRLHVPARWSLGRSTRRGSRPR